MIEKFKNFIGKIKNFRKDLSDISSSEVSTIQNETILIKEYEHINRLLEKKEDLVNKLVIFLISGVAIFIGFIIKNLFDLIEKAIQPENEALLKEQILLKLNILLYGSLIFVIIFTFFTIIELINRKKIIDRKVLLLTELKKSQKTTSKKRLRSRSVRQ